MKKIILLFVFISFVFGLAACNKEVDVDLESPTNVAITGDVVSWDAVAEADSYIVFINTTEVPVQATSYNLALQELAAGDYSISVVAVKDEKISLPSTVLPYTVEADVNTQLSAPTGVSITNGILTWTAVTGATSYTVHVGSQTFTSTQATFNLSQQSFAVGSYQVYVVATAGTDESANSASVTYVVELNVEQDAIKLAVIRKMDSSYTLDLDEDDFEDEYEYNEYLNALDMANAYSTGVLMNGMSEVDAIALFNEVFLMVGLLADDMTVDEIIMGFDIFDDYDMESIDVANMLYELVYAMLDVNIRDLEWRITYEEEQLPDIQARMDAITSSATYLAAYNYMKSFATPAQEDAVDALFSGQYGEIISSMYEISNYALYGGYPMDPNYYSDDPMVVGYIQDLMDLSVAIIADSEGTAYFENIYNTISELYNLNNIIYWDFNFVQMYIDEYEDEILTQEEIKVIFEDNKDEIIDSIVVVIDFVLTFEESLSQNTIDTLKDMIDGEELTMAEMFTLKDELVIVLETAMPSAQDFTTVYETMFIIGGSVAGVDMTDYMSYAAFLGQADALAIDLMLALVSDIDQTLIDDAMAILADAEDEYGMIDLENNPEVAIEFILFVVDFMEDFAVDNAVTISAMQALVTDEMLEDVYVMVFDLISEQIENDEMGIDPDEKAIILSFLDDMALEFDTYKALVDIFGDTTSDVLSYMIDSELSLIETIINLEAGDGMSMVSFLTDIASIIGEINNIDIEIFDEVDSAQLQVLFDALELPLRTIFEINEPELDFDAIYAALVPELKTIMLNVISLQSDILENADSITSLSLIAIITNTNLGNYEMGLYSAIITVMSDTFTPANETMILDTLDIIFDDILSNQDILDVTMMQQSFVDDLKLDTVDAVQSFIDEFQALGLLDFDNLTVLEEERINDFFADIMSVLVYEEEIYIGK